MTSETSAPATVIVPTYNGERYLAATLDSLAAQTPTPPAVVVVDDGSSDGSVEIARSHDAVAQVLQQPNLGVAVARNRGLAMATTPWVAFLDQDDLWHEERLATMLDVAAVADAPAVATTESRFALDSDREALEAVSDGRETWPEAWIAAGDEPALVRGSIAGASGEVSQLTLDRLLEGAAMLTTTVLYRREVAISAGGCAPHARALDDHVLNLNVARIGGPIPRIDSRQLLYRVHSRSTTTVSPMVAPFLSTQAAVRLGGVFPREHRAGANVEHLLYGLARSDATAAEQLALLLLTVPRGRRARWLRRWATRRVGLR
ncbi:glycosyltransferase family A protein [Demequina sp. NBRC 110053]|uniref:glycosyltransferase family 2 protein n=1 Tax=Demequina sp. NBRC 110053 TaxID=1570342 RepID=UPI000A006912|nr:glycosyltransferase family A protein [Demequina sp. NBRC 110053]